MSETNCIYTIGYGNRKIDDFVSLLTKYDVRFLIDLRSKPFSKFNPDFSKDRLTSYLDKKQIKYVFMGDTLGGLPTDRSCYTEDGYVDYQIVMKKPFFKSGLERLKSAYNQKLPVVIMCSETKPHECHRSKLIGEALSAENVKVLHIDESGDLKDQEEVISKITDSQMSLFGETVALTSRKKYLASAVEGID